MRRKILLLLVVSLCTSIGGGIAASGAGVSAPERISDAFL